MRLVPQLTKALAVVAAIVFVAGCSENNAPPAPGGKTTDSGGMARPHGEPPAKGKKTLPRLDD